VADPPPTTDEDVPVGGPNGRRCTLEEAYALLRDPAFYRSAVKFSRMFQAERLQVLLAQFEAHEKANDPLSWRKLQNGVRAINARVPAVTGRERDPGLAVNLWLDDIRTPPDKEWTWVRTPEDAIEILQAGRVQRLSLDHDLGLDAAESERTGYSVLVWLEAEIAHGRWSFPLPEIRIHSANPVGRKRMQQAIASIECRHQQSNRSR
jgi:hypothetical protein